MEGVHYFFKTREEFEQMIEEDAFFEHAEYCGNYYGTPKAYVEEHLSKGRNVILEIEIQGALKIKEQRPDALLLFVRRRMPKPCGNVSPGEERRVRKWSSSGCHAPVRRRRAWNITITS